MEGAAGHRGEALLDELRAAVDGAGDLGAVEQGAVGYAVDVGLVVLADVGGVGAGDRALLAHPGHGDGGVEAAGEGDADAFSDGQGGEDLAHVGFLTSSWGGAAGPGWPRTRPARPISRRTTSSPPAGSREITRTLSSPAIVPSTSASSALSSARGEEVRRTRRGAEHDQVGARLCGHQQLLAQPGEPALAGRGLARRDGRAVAALGGHGVHQGAGGGADLDGVELDEVAAERGLGDDDTVAREQLAELALRRTSLRVQQVDLELLAGALGRRDVRVSGVFRVMRTRPRGARR